MCAVRYAGTLLQGGAVEFEVEKGVITSVTPIKDSPALPWIMPVLVDLQQNGAMGYSFSNLKSPEELRAITETLYRHGVGRVQATTVSVPVETLTASMQLLARECDNDPVLNKVIFGLFHEGIFMSFEEGWRGDHDLECIKKPDWDLFRKIDDASGNRFVTINTAPEVPGAMEFISKAVAAGTSVRAHLGGGYMYTGGYKKLSDGQTAEMKGVAKGRIPYSLRGGSWTAGAAKAQVIMLINWGNHKAVTQVKDIELEIEK